MKLTATTPGRQQAWHRPTAVGLTELVLSILFVARPGLRSGSSSGDMEFRVDFDG